MAALKITKDNFQTEVLEAKETVLVDFWASWCGPCKMIGPIIDQIADERSDIKVCKINVDEEQELAVQFKVMSIPTLLVFKEGKVVNQSLGAKPKAAILAMLD
ncbi:MAG: thioredoxin [Lachnospiraceae bacterium]|nr:thioredoxin [Lachnospiraceae bacterium]